MKDLFYRSVNRSETLATLVYGLIGWRATRRFERLLVRFLDTTEDARKLTRAELVADFWRSLDKTDQSAVLRRSHLARIWAPAYLLGYWSAADDPRATQLSAPALRWLWLGVRPLTRPVAWKRMIYSCHARGLQPRRTLPAATPARLLQLLTVYDQIDDIYVHYQAAAVHNLWRRLNEDQRSQVRATDPRLRIWEAGHRSGRRYWRPWRDEELAEAAAVLRGTV